MEKTLEERWFPFTTYCLNDTEHKKIFCFHHAGGSASVYRKWTLEKKNMNVVVDIIMKRSDMHEN